jgi:alpha(1,3/1,4) fucosyltransferase
MAQLFARLKVTGIEAEILMNVDHPMNRDNLFYPYWLLKQRFHERGVALSGADQNETSPVSFEIHANIQSVKASVPAYQLLMETPQIAPLNGRADLYGRYRKIFTWRDDLVGIGAIKLNFPNKVGLTLPSGWSERSGFACLIAGNKVLSQPDPSDLYSERVNTIRWFETHAADSLDLYGVGWDLPPPQRGRVGRVLRPLERVLVRMSGKKPFPLYRGAPASKQEVLSRYRFSICYENVSNWPSYITEKIFDCFFAGCVPVYWGAPNIEDHVPADCFVDRRQFSSHAQLFAFLSAMKESEFIGYQQRIYDFLNNDGMTPFSADTFADSIVNGVMSDY